MAHVLLSGVLTKLAQFSVESILSLCRVNDVVEKLKSLYGIREEVEKLHRELMYIHDFIRDADKKQVVDQREMRWMKDVMDIAYQIEDAVDIFLFECSEKLPGLKLKDIPKKITKIPFLYNFKEEIKEIQDRICEIHDYKTKYGIKILGEEKITQSNPGLKLDLICDPKAFGLEAHIDNIVKDLLDNENKNLAVVSIVGIGGLGKTTLARKVCNSSDIQKSFGEPIWITISQKYDLLDILRKIADKLGIQSTDLESIRCGCGGILKVSVQHNLDGNRLANLICKSLQERRYLIVLDDIWIEGLWTDIKKILPDKENGSRVLVTTRIVNVAKLADTTNGPYEPPFLDSKESVKLLLKYVVPENHNSSKDIPSHFESLAIKFVEKCKGLPLALVVLGTLLSKTPYNFHAWKQLLQTMSWQNDELNECIKIISSSFDHLPFVKKLCFLYFAAFPKGHKIEAKPLLRIWVAEQLIPQEERRTLEETAECFLEDLVQRNMVQVSERFPDGSIKYCRLHDVISDLAILKAKEINFLMVLSKQDDWKLCRKARRVSIHYSQYNAPIDCSASPNVRSLLLFSESEKGVELDCSKNKVLRVLGSMKKKVKLVTFQGSPHLRYIQLNSNILGNERDFGTWIEGKKYLETLDLRSSDHGDLSHWIWKVKTLKHVLLSPIHMKTQGPPSSVDLRCLQTLRNVRFNELWVTLSLPDIFEVRELDIQIYKNNSLRFPKSEVATLATLLFRLNKAVYLKIQGDIIDLLSTSKGGFLFHENLKSLILINYHHGCRDDIKVHPEVLRTQLPKRQRHIADTAAKPLLEQAPASRFGSSPPWLVIGNNMLPTHLTELQLEGYEFASDPMLVLEKLESLNSLWIRGTSRKTDYPLSIRCSAKGFKQLEKLVLKELILKEWIIATGAFPMLKWLTVMLCPGLSMPTGINLERLQYLKWEGNEGTNNQYKQGPTLRTWDDHDIED